MRISSEEHITGQTTNVAAIRKPTFLWGGDGYELVTVRYTCHRDFLLRNNRSTGWNVDAFGQSTYVLESPKPVRALSECELRTGR
jgi:hypothetical protein